MMPRVLIAAIALLTLSPVVQAEIYKWVDSGGHIHYSDKPPAQRAEKLDIESRPTDPERIAALDEKRLQAAEQREAAAAAQADRARVEAEQQSARDKNCAIARKALASLVSATRVYEPLPDGGRRYLEQDEVDERMARARADVDEWCNAGP